jgi:hypothetical protein
MKPHSPAGVEPRRCSDAGGRVLFEEVSPFLVCVRADVAAGESLVQDVAGGLLRRLRRWCPMRVPRAHCAATQMAMPSRPIQTSDQMGSSPRGLGGIP